MSKTPWWSHAVIYQIYPRSFADSTGSGMGDLPGVIAKLPYLAELGVDAIWLSPFYVSPQQDAGYDVADYRDVDPLFGTLADADRLITATHEHGLKIIVDLVPNHTSDQHPWFQQALGDPDARDRYIFRDQPNNWLSHFGGKAWTQITEPDGTPGPYYLHLFDTSQPDLNWEHPEVREEFENILRFWLDRGVDGFRVDVAHGLVKQAGLPDHPHRPGMITDAELDHNITDSDSFTPVHPFYDQEGVHEIYRSWHRVLEEYQDRMMVAEAWISPLFRLFRYVRPDEMQQAFNFTFLTAGYDAQALHEAIDISFAEAHAVGAPVTWVLSNHDTVRHASRFGLPDPTSYPDSITAEDIQPDEALGRRRALAAAMIELALPGSAYIYQGDELGLPEHTTLPNEARQDPTYRRTRGAEYGRDGARVPMPWRAGQPDGWLPAPESYHRLAVDQQDGVPGSFLETYRQLLRLRAEYRLGSGQFAWSAHHDPHRGVLAFTVTTEDHTGTQRVEVIANLSDRPVTVAPGELLIGPGYAESMVEPDSTAWLIR
ncbi:glycoside hydrolase family 13 protein [Auritidibacter ignavus]|uniref:Glycoside hydrolase family 13 protein n=1 Tax=Auritidibacter ignavus TaxID=678932 RepID=A0AAJ6ALT4_9MICC|nr:glycoside hydrolase family 13 protein [Auritidibacter ignavus]WGH92306.1 glycoside hydrolase family 13 protein [Auritidibacter ignavus]WHS34027.1 glycoside hydrolase family 13 protein [Auritidibacter ignavus]